MHIDTHTLPEVWQAMTGDPKPTLANVAAGLSSVPRWLNRTIRPWSTLQHVLLCEAAAGADETPVNRLAILFHDAEDMVCSDVPSPVKSPEQAVVEEMFRQHVWQEIVGCAYPKGEVWGGPVKQVDLLVRHVEGATLLPPHLRWSDCESVDLSITRALLELLEMDRFEVIHHFTTLVEGLLDHSTVRALVRRG